MTRHGVTADRLGAVFDALRGGRLRVHCITSVVAAERTANTLLALGVRPSLTIDPEEVGDFVRAGDGLLINLGMVDPARAAAIPRAIAAAKAAQRPWVLDPVFVNVSSRRMALARACLTEGPDVLKANAEEAALLAEAPPATVRIATGATDLVQQGERQIGIGNGHPYGGRVTAVGCALGAVIAAALAVEADPFVASAAAVSAYGIAVERAAARAAGPGSFGIALYDTLAALTGADLARESNIS
jgi:hydroxyethylthiazole kinase